MTPEIEARVREAFVAQQMLQTFGAVITALEAGLCIVAAPVTEAVHDRQGLVHPAYAFALAEGAATCAALSRLPDSQDLQTAEMKITHLASARCDQLVAEARVEGASARLIVVSAAVYARTGDLREKIALVQGTLLPT